MCLSLFSLASSLISKGVNPGKLLYSCFPGPETNAATLTMVTRFREGVLQPFGNDFSLHLWSRKPAGLDISKSGNKWECDFGLQKNCFPKILR